MLFIFFFWSSWVFGDDHFDEESDSVIDCYLEQYIMDFQDSLCCEINLLAKWNPFVKAIYQKNYHAFLASELPSLTTKTEYIVAGSFLLTGIGFYAFPITRPFGIRLIQIGFSIIGYGNITDFCEYLEGKGFFSDQEWNIFKKILGDVVFNNGG